MMRPDAKVEKVYLHPKPVDFRKPIDGLAVAVGMAVTCHPPHRSVRAELPHTAPALGFDAEAGYGIRMHS